MYGKSTFQGGRVMKCKVKPVVLMPLGFLLLPLMLLHSAYSCAAIGGFLMNEATVIVWNQQTHTEHFIRRATFEDIEGKSVGFIVPTPAVPQLAEGDADVFIGLDHMTEPETETRELQDISLESWLFPSWNYPLIKTPEPLPADMAAAADAAIPVEVLQHQRIGDLDAVTVRASNGTRLNQWLHQHQFDSRPAFEKWLDFYVRKGWVVTAFRFVSDKDISSIASPLIRMSFKTDRPFYPYREPQDEGASRGRELRIYLFSSGRMQAAPGNFGKAKKWWGEVKWSDDLQHHPARFKHLDPPLSTQFSLPEADLKQAHWMTVFEDYSGSRRGADDLTFIPAPNESMVPYPIITYKRNEIRIPVEAIMLLIGIVGVFIKTRRRRSDS
jgi:hypothetical protein